MPEVLALIEERMQVNDETTATQFVKMVNSAATRCPRVHLFKRGGFSAGLFNVSNLIAMIARDVL